MRDKHPNKDIEAALRYIETLGWRVERRKTGHCWGIAMCPHQGAACRNGVFCRNSIWSTPGNPGAQARKIKRWADNCAMKDDE